MDIPKILICDDDPSICHALELYLRESGYESEIVHNGEDALLCIDRDPEICLVLLDIMMPGIDGIKTLQRIRKVRNLPVILLTAKASDKDVIVGLQQGADDYITKPFQPRELQARVTAQLRRFLLLGAAPEKTNQSYQTGGLCLNEAAGLCTVSGRPVELTRIEWQILLTLFQNCGKVLTTREIYERAWQEPCVGGESAVTVHIRHLREKIEPNPSQPIYIRVVWGRGYCLTRFEDV